MQLNRDGRKDPEAEIQPEDAAAGRSQRVGGWQGAGLGGGAEAEPRKSLGIRPGKQVAEARESEGGNAAEQKPKDGSGRKE